MDIPFHNTYIIHRFPQKVKKGMNIFIIIHLVFDGMGEGMERGRSKPLPYGGVGSTRATVGVGASTTRVPLQNVNASHSRSFGKLRMTRNEACARNEPHLPHLCLFGVILSVSEESLPLAAIPSTKKNGGSKPPPYGGNGDSTRATVGVGALDDPFCTARILKSKRLPLAR